MILIKRQTDKANKKDCHKKDSLSSSATSKMPKKKLNAIDSVNMDGLTDEMKSALKSAIDNKVSVSVEPSSIEISGLTGDAKNALGDAPSADKLYWQS